MPAFIVGFIGSIVGFLTKYFSKGAVKVGIQYGFTFAYVAVIVSFYAFLINTLVHTYNIISDVLNDVQSLTNGIGGGGFCIGEAISATLTCFGVIDGLNAAKPVLLSAIMFVFSFILYRIGVSAKKAINDIINETLRLI